MTEAFQKLWVACQDAALERDERSGAMPMWNISPETYRFWKEQPGYNYPLSRGNAKTRRRYRRRNIPNSQRASAQMRPSGWDWIRGAKP